jgi:hypothetical protein
MTEVADYRRTLFQNADSFILAEANDARDPALFGRAAQ